MSLPAIIYEIVKNNITEIGSDLQKSNYSAVTSQGATIAKNYTKNETILQLALYDILIPVIGLLVIVTNLLVVISSGLLLKRGQEPRCTYLLLGNVALADLIIGISVVIGAAYPESLSVRNHTTCCIHLGTIVSSTVASVYSVVLIAVDRFLYILHGLKYHRLVYITRVRSIIVATWLFGCFIGFLPLMGWSGDTMNGRRCWFTMAAPPKLIILTSLSGIVPIVFVTVLYSIILYRAIKKVIQLRAKGNETDEINNPTKLRVFRGGTPRNSQIETISEKVDSANVSSITSSQQWLGRNDSEDSLPNTETDSKTPRSFKKNEKPTEDLQTQSNAPTKWKAIKVVVFTTGSFACTWMPYFIACSVYVHCNPDNTPNVCHKLRLAIASPLAILGFVNSLLNPIIYAWWHNGFRNAIKKMYWKRKKISLLKNNLKRSQVTKSRVNTDLQVAAV